jgi:predicted kinase
MIEVLVGMIASGKSTWAKDRAKEGWIIINDDSIVNAVHADDYLLYQQDLKPLYKSIEDHILHTAVAMGKNVVVDRGLSLSATARRRWIALANSLDTPVQAVLFDVFSPEVHAQRRFESDSRGHDLDYWLRVAQRHHSVYDEPTLDEGFESIEVRKWT